MDLAARREAAQTAQQLMQSSPIILDTETTGVGPHAEVIEIAIVNTQGQILFESLVRPRSRIEPNAIRIHGITPEMVRTAPVWHEIWPQVEPILLARPVGAYNSDFDLRLLKQTHKYAMLPWSIPDTQFFCIMKLYARFAGEYDRVRHSYRWHSLEQAGRHCELTLPNTHHARDDALLARAILEYMAQWKVS